MWYIGGHMNKRIEYKKLDAINLLFNIISIGIIILVAYLLAKKTNLGFYSRTSLTVLLMIIIKGFSEGVKYLVSKINS